MDTIRTVIVDDDPQFRESLATFLEHVPGFELTAAYPAPERLLEAAAAMRGRSGTPQWDLVLMDIEMPRLDGIETVRRLRELWPDLPVVMLTVFEDPRTIVRAITAGASGYVLKKSSARELATQLRAVLEGGAPLSPAVASTVLGVVRELEQAGPPAGDGTTGSPARLALSDRERDVLRALVQGLTYQQAADELGLSIGTIRTHVRSVYRKLQVNSVAQAVRKALDRGLC